VSWRPASDVPTARLRAEMLRRARAFFGARDVLEVDTPALGRYTVTDPNIESHRVLSAGDRDLFLQTSPEAFMKRLLAGGYPDIYAICRVFRDGESGRLHQPEFTIVEWYRRGYGLAAMAAEAAQFITTLMDRPGLMETQSYDYVDAFRRFVNLDPLAATSGELAAAASADAALRAAIGDDRDAWLDLLLATRVASRFQSGKLTVLRHFPASQAALARRCPDNAAVADRFEIFCGPLELANGYVELGDAAEQRRRAMEDLDKRRRRHRRQVPVDEPLLAALDAGLPACAGVAVGFERVLMLAAGVDDIRQVVTFAFDDQGVGRQ